MPHATSIPETSLLKQELETQPTGPLKYTPRPNGWRKHFKYLKPLRLTAPVLAPPGTEEPPPLETREIERGSDHHNSQIIDDGSHKASVSLTIGEGIKEASSDCETSQIDLNDGDKPLRTSVASLDASYLGTDQSVESSRADTRSPSNWLRRVCHRDNDHKSLLEVPSGNSIGSATLRSTRSCDSLFSRADGEKARKVLFD